MLMTQKEQVEKAEQTNSANSVEKPIIPPFIGSTPQNVRLQAERVGLKRYYLKDFYHFFLTTRWRWLLLFIVGTYLLLNLFFAFLYYLGRPCVEGTFSFSDLFFFSVQTMATIGYGKMVPVTAFAHVLVTIESLIGLSGFALATALMFAKFSRPTARLIFSKNVVISNRDGVPSLMLRIANERGNQIVEAQARLVLARSETTLEGEQVRRFYELPLSRDRNAIFALTWTVVHPITKESPLYGVTTESLQAQGATLLVSLMGMDETFSQTVHARYTYLAEEIRWGYRFVDILTRLPQNRVRVNYTYFHDIQKAD